MIIDPYSAAQYSGYFGRMTEAEILAGIKTAREERLRLREINEKKRVNFERSLRQAKSPDDREGKLIDIVSEGKVEEDKKNLDEFA
jgi:hypothetical protein